MRKVEESVCVEAFGELLLREMSVSSLKIGLAGFGNVGAGVYKNIEKNQRLLRVTDNRALLPLGGGLCGRGAFTRLH